MKVYATEERAIILKMASENCVIFRSAFQPMDLTGTSSKNSQFLIKNLLNLPNEKPPETLASKVENVPHSLHGSFPLLDAPLMPRPLRPLIVGGGDFNPLQLFQVPTLQLPSFPEELALPSRCPAQVWMHSSRYSGHGLATGYNPFLKRRKRFMRKPKQRPLFSHNQIQRLEKEFGEEKYLTETKRAELSKDLGMTETQVKTWFQNRRTKWRKELKDELSTTARAKDREWEGNHDDGGPSSSAYDVSAARNGCSTESYSSKLQSLQDARMFIDLASPRPRFVRYGGVFGR